MMIVKFHKLPMKISEETLFFNFTHSAMYYIHTHSGFLLFSYIFTHQCLFGKESTRSCQQNKLVMSMDNNLRCYMHL